jgi:hypothetical protein
MGKPFRGQIKNWRRLDVSEAVCKKFAKNLGYVIIGFWIDGQKTWRTSLVVSFRPDDVGDNTLIETLNSTYLLIGREKTLLAAHREEKNREVG